jgi:hypothetical protein
VIFRIPAGKHYSRPFRFGIWWGKKQFIYKVKFTESCRYDLGDDDQLDTNKLFGVGYLPHHHTDSARYGWRYNKESGQIELLLYCYVNKLRSIILLASCEIGKEYILFLTVNKDNYNFKVIDENGQRIGGYALAFYHHKKFQYGLWPYFGGNKVAPHEMKIEIQKL